MKRQLPSGVWTESDREPTVVHTFRSYEVRDGDLYPLASGHGWCFDVDPAPTGAVERFLSALRLGDSDRCTLRTVMFTWALEAYGDYPLLVCARSAVAEFLRQVLDDPRTTIPFPVLSAAVYEGLARNRPFWVVHLSGGAPAPSWLRTRRRLELFSDILYRVRDEWYRRSDTNCGAWVDAALRCAGHCPEIRY